MRPSGPIKYVTRCVPRYFLPMKSASEILPPPFVVAVNSGALSPSFSFISGALLMGIGLNRYIVKSLKTLQRYIVNSGQRRMLGVRSHQPLRFNDVTIHM